MKKSFLLINASLLFLTFSTLFVACKKQENEKNPRRAFKANASTWYRIAPSVPGPVTVGESVYSTYAYVPGGGEGNATHMGKVKTYFNQLSYTANLNVPIPTPLGSVVAPVVDVVNYPVFGAPLPLIQAGDFNELSSLISSFNIPSSINGKIISSFFYNSKGDVVYISNSSVSTITETSATRNDFSGQALIIGGRGKFVNATGEVGFTGWFNPNDPNNAGYSVDGWISF